jgi:predicted MFS family arabinose efflux permease
VPLLRDEQGSSLTVAGLHGTALAAGALVAGFLSPPLVRARGRGWALWGGAAMLCAGIVVYVSTTVLALTLLGALIASVGGSTLINASAPVLGEHHGPAGPASISEANACATAVGTVAPLAIGAAVAGGVSWRVGPLSTLVLLAALALALGRTPIPTPHPTPAVAYGARALPWRYWVLWAALVASIAAEFCLALWAADELRGRTGLSAGGASAGVTAFVGGMTAGRLLGGRLALRVRADTLLLGAAAVAVGGFALFWLPTAPAPALAGLVVVGAGVALLYPLGVVLAMAAAEGRPDLATAASGWQRRWRSGRARSRWARSPTPSARIARSSSCRHCWSLPRLASWPSAVRPTGSPRPPRTRRPDVRQETRKRPTASDSSTDSRDSVSAAAAVRAAALVVVFAPSATAVTVSAI